MRMVDADKLEKAVIGAGIFKDGWEFKTAWGIPVVDAEPVVRCEDCDTEPCDYYTAVNWCSRGHRRENEKR